MTPNAARKAKPYNQRSRPLAHQRSPAYSVVADSAALAYVRGRYGRVEPV